MVAEYSVEEPRLLLAGSRAEVDPYASADLLEGDILLVEEGLRHFHPEGGKSHSNLLVKGFRMYIPPNISGILEF